MFSKDTEGHTKLTTSISHSNINNPKAVKELNFYLQWHPKKWYSTQTNMRFYNIMCMLSCGPISATHGLATFLPGFLSMKISRQNSICCCHVRSWGSSWPRDWTAFLFALAGGFFTTATWVSLPNRMNHCEN